MKVVKSQTPSFPLPEKKEERERGKRSHPGSRLKGVNTPVSWRAVTCGGRVGAARSNTEQRNSPDARWPHRLATELSDKANTAASVDRCPHALVSRGRGGGGEPPDLRGMQGVLPFCCSNVAVEESLLDIPASVPDSCSPSELALSDGSSSSGEPPFAA